TRTRPILWSGSPTTSSPEEGFLALFTEAESNMNDLVSDVALKLPATYQNMELPATVHGLTTIYQD
ncbi:hypothetical protein ACJX0J_015966, partial [Zea mays]